MPRRWRWHRVHRRAAALLLLRSFCCLPTVGPDHPAQPWICLLPPAAGSGCTRQRGGAVQINEAANEGWEQPHLPPRCRGSREAGRAARTAPRAARCCGGFVVLLGRVSVRSGGFHSSRTALWGSQPGQTLRSGVMGSVCPLPARAACGTEHPRSTLAPSRLLPGSRAPSSALLSFKGGEESGRRPCQTKAPAVAGGAGGDGPGCCAHLVLPLEREGAWAGWEEPCGLC